MKNKKAFTLIELIAVIVILAIIALITVPKISSHIRYSKVEAFRTTINSYISSYRYKEMDEGNDLGRVTACSLIDGKCDFSGYLDKCDNDTNKICVYLTNGNYCAIGDSESFNVEEGSCISNNDPIVINNITVNNITVTSATVIVSFTEKGLVSYYSNKFGKNVPIGKIKENVHRQMYLLYKHKKMII